MASGTDAHSDILSLAQWDARVTSDGKVSVVDVIACVRQCSYKYAWEMYKRLLAEERIPKYEIRALPPRCVAVGHQTSANGRRLEGDPRRGRGDRDTPVATVAEMVQTIWQLPGTAELRSKCAKLTVHYLGGDETLVDEIRTNRAAQEELAATNPTHPARIFGEAR